MASGVDVDIVDGVAYIEFADPAVKHAYLPKLLEAGGPQGVKLDTGGTRRTYIVSEDTAKAAGLVDKPKASTRRSR